MGDELTLQQILEVAGFGFGTVLHVILLRMIQRRRRKRPAEGLFAVLVLATGLWNAGNFAYAFAQTLLPGEPLPVLRVAADAVALVGVAAVPSLSLHTLLALLALQSDSGPPGRRGLGPLAAILYAPLVFLPLVLARLMERPSTGMLALLSEPMGPFPSVLGAFLFWFMAAFLVSAGLSFVLARRRRLESSRERTFYMSLAGILVGTAGLVLAIYRIGAEQIHDAGLTLEVLVILASTVPSLLFAYYIHRHHDVEFLLRRSLFYLLLIVATVLIYLWGISTFSHWLEQQYGLHHQLVEAILIIGLVFAFHPFRRGLQRLFTQVFFRETHTYRAVLNELASSLRRGPVRRLSTLLDQVAATMRKTLRLEDATVIVLEGPEPGASGAHWGRTLVHQPRTDAIRDWLERTGLAWAALHDLEEAENDAAVAEMASLGAEVVFAVRYERRLTGLFALGRKRDRSPFFAEELVVCGDLADHIAVTIETHRLYEEKLGLERKILETEKLLSLGRFSASVAHRVKNPLSSIKAICQVMREDFEADDSRRADLGVVVGEVDRLTDVVNQLLDFAEPRGGERADDRRHGCDVLEVIDEVAVLFQPEAAVYRVEIVRPDPPPVGETRPLVDGSRLDLREVLSNLIQNGIHAMPRGGTLAITVEAPAPLDAFLPESDEDDEDDEVHDAPILEAQRRVTEEVTSARLPGATSPEAAADGDSERADAADDGAEPRVEASLDDDDAGEDEETSAPSERTATPAPRSDELLITITDTGVGIPAEAKAKVFEPFFTSKARGTGLGLAIARHKVEKLGGTLGLRSPAPDPYRPTARPDDDAPAGPGTTFAIRLRLAAPTTPRAETDSEDSSAPVTEAAPAAEVAVGGS